jgi:hypothetical protein
LIRADAGPPEPTDEDVVDAAAVLRKRLNEDAVRWLCRYFGYHDLGVIRRSECFYREFIRLGRLEVDTADEFALRLSEAHDDNWSREARLALPDDLRVLALQYWCDKGWFQDTEALDVLLDQLGLYSRHRPNEITMFGKSSVGESIGRIRIDVIARESDLNKWLSTPEEVKRRFGFGEWSSARLRFVGNYKVLKSFAHRYELGDEQELYSGIFWLGRGSNDFDSDEPGQFVKWVRSAVLTEQQLERFMQLRDACNCNIKEMQRVLERQRYRAKPQQFLIGGLIPQSVLVLLLAKQKVGKTNAMLELAVAVARWPAPGLDDTHLS